MRTEPWIDADGADVETIVKTIQQCPSGALSYAIDDEEHRDQEREPEVHISKDGPYYVRGGVELQDVAWGEGASKEHYTLCRCGGSKNKPFCDGTHWYIDFKDDESKTRGVAAEGVEKELTWYRVADVDAVPEAMTFLGVAVITFAAIQLIRESKLLITVVLDDAERESTSQ